MRKNADNQDTQPMYSTRILLLREQYKQAHKPHRRMVIAKTISISLVALLLIIIFASMVQYMPAIKSPFAVQPTKTLIPCFHETIYSTGQKIIDETCK